MLLLAFLAHGCSSEATSAADTIADAAPDTNADTLPYTAGDTLDELPLDSQADGSPDIIFDDVSDTLDGTAAVGDAVVSVGDVTDVDAGDAGGPIAAGACFNIS